MLPFVQQRSTTADLAPPDKHRGFNSLRLFQRDVYLIFARVVLFVRRIMRRMQHVLTERTPQYRKIEADDDDVAPQVGRIGRVAKEYVASTRRRARCYTTLMF